MPVLAHYEPAPEPDPPAPPVPPDPPWDWTVAELGLHLTPNQQDIVLARLRALKVIPSTVHDWKYPPPEVTP